MDAINRGWRVPSCGRILGGRRCSTRRAGVWVVVVDIRQCPCGDLRGTKTSSEEEGANAKQGGRGRSAREWDWEGDLSGPGVLESFVATVRTPASPLVCFQFVRKSAFRPVGG